MLCSEKNCVSVLFLAAPEQTYTFQPLYFSHYSRRGMYSLTRPNSRNFRTLFKNRNPAASALEFRLGIFVTFSQQHIHFTAHCPLRVLANNCIGITSWQWYAKFSQLGLGGIRFTRPKILLKSLIQGNWAEQIIQ